MAKHAKGVAETKSWDEKPFREMEGGQKLSKATVIQSLTGDIAGEAETEYVMAYPSDTYASYVSMVVVTGAIEGKQGSFVLQASGTYDGTIASGTWFVVPGSGTGALKGLRGEGGFRAPHGSKMDYTLDYHFE
jgi:hypothetical protein